MSGKAKKEPVWPVDENGNPVSETMADLILNDEDLAYDVISMLHSNNIPAKLEYPKVCGGSYAVAVNVPFGMQQEAKALIRQMNP